MDSTCTCIIVGHHYPDIGGRQKIITKCVSARQLILQRGVAISACVCRYIYIYMYNIYISGYVSLGPVMYNTLHSIAPGSGSISSRPDRVPGGREYRGCFLGTRSGVT